MVRCSLTQPSPVTFVWAAPPPAQRPCFRFGRRDAGVPLGSRKPPHEAVAGANVSGYGVRFTSTTRMPARIRPAPAAARAERVSPVSR
jgi:hypothetical protein